MIEVVRPDWPAPAGVHAFTTTRAGGVSGSPYGSLNLGDHVGDSAEAVAENRRRLVEQLSLPGVPGWLTQVHGTAVHEAGAAAGCEGDGVVSDHPGRVCAVLTADCLPILLCNRDGGEVAALHAGWRGLAAGVVEATVARLRGEGEQLLAWLGPAIGPRAFEVGEEVRAAFMAVDGAAERAFAPSADGRWLADLYLLARQRLAWLGIERVYGGDRCTYNEAEQFFSYRRDGVTGRMASLIWIARG